MSSVNEETPTVVIEEKKGRGCLWGCLVVLVGCFALFICSGIGLY